MIEEHGVGVKLAVIETKLESVIGELARLRHLASRPSWPVASLLAVLSSSLTASVAVLLTRR